MMMIAPNSCARKGEKERGEVKRGYGGIWGEEGNADYGGNGATQLATCYTMCKTGWGRIGHEGSLSVSIVANGAHLGTLLNTSEPSYREVRPFQGP